MRPHWRTGRCWPPTPTGGAPTPDFDVHLLGMGGEGHVNSLFPHSPATRETDPTGRRRHRLPQASPGAHHADVARRHPRSREVWLVVAGSEKAEAVAAAVGGAASDDVPAAGAVGRDS